LLVLTGLLFVGLCAILRICDARQASNSTGFVLLSDFSFSNLNSTSAEAPEGLSAEASQTDPDLGSLAATKVIEPVPVPAPTKERARELAPVEPVPIILVADLQPAREPCYPIREPHRGDTPMKRTWKLLGMNTLLAALLASGPSHGQTSD